MIVLQNRVWKACIRYRHLFIIGSRSVVSCYRVSILCPRLFSYIWSDRDFAFADNECASGTMGNAAHQGWHIKLMPWCHCQQQFGIMGLATSSVACRSRINFLNITPVLQVCGWSCLCWDNACEIRHAAFWHLSLAICK